MDDLLVLLALIPIALVVLMIVLLVRMGGLSREIRRTREQLFEFMQRSAYSGPIGEPIQPEGPSEARAPVPPEPPPIITPPAEPVPEPTVDELTVQRMEALFPEDRPQEASDRGPTIHVVEPPFTPPSPKPPRLSFFERHPDLEKFIGENLINKIGITVLVIGIGLLLRYAIGKGMISETGRTMIGLLAGALLVFFAHRSRTNFRAFSSVLVAGGIAVFYFSIAIAFHQYQLIGQLPAFAIMVVITGLAVLFTLAYDRKELAVIALLGGFATPFMVSTGEGSFRILFTYLLILDVGMLVLANYKKWHIINILSFVLTLLLFGSWAMIRYPEMEPRPTLQAFGFATAFFLVFFGMNLRYNLRHRQVFAALDHALLLLNTAAFYGVGIYLLSDLVTKVTGLFTVLIGLFYLLFALYFHRKQGIPSALKFLLIGLVLTFISLAAPVQLEGSYITMFWAAEAVLLLWFAERSGLRLVERASVVVLGLMLLSLWMDLDNIYGWGGPEAMRPLLNKGWVTGMISAIALGAMTVLLRRREPDHFVLLGVKAQFLAQVTAAVAAIVLYRTNYLEQQYQLSRVLDVSVVNMALMAFTLLFVLGLDMVTRKANALYRSIIGVLLVVCGLVYVTEFYGNSRQAIMLEQSGTGVVGFIPFHYLALVLMVIAVVRIAYIARDRIPRPSTAWTIYLWTVCTFIVLLASQELDHFLLIGRSGELSTYETLASGRRVGYPILWGIGSFIMMWYGMRKRLRMMRVIALSLFAITLIKLFLIDLGALSEGGRVAAFIFLGALLLVISFMYQKLKLLLIDDVPTNTGTDVPAE